LDSGAKLGRGRRAARVRRALALLGLLGLTTFLVGCAGRSARPAMPVDQPACDLETRLRAEIDGWLGTPHCDRTDSDDCTDCSGFVVSVYQRLFHVSLPRRALDIAACGTEVKPRELRCGDLVLFQTSSKTRHVGIYLRNGDFAHTSSSRGVMVSNLRERYWAKRFWTARRVVS
jgi:cell wall-associated NlpC family hydrolase